MLDHRERESLFEINRRRRHAGVRTTIADLSLWGALLAGPRALTAAETRTRGSRPRPRVATSTHGVTARPGSTLLRLPRSRDTVLSRGVTPGDPVALARWENEGGVPRSRVEPHRADHREKESSRD